MNVFLLDCLLRLPYIIDPTIYFEILFKYGPALSGLPTLVPEIINAIL